MNLQARQATAAEMATLSQNLRLGGEKWAPHPFGGFLDQYCGGYPHAIVAEIISDSPLIIYTNLDHGRPLGLADVWTEKGYGRIQGLPQRVYFLIALWWSIDDESAVKWIREAAIRHRQVYPDHVLLFLCNTEKETERLNRAGEVAVLSNHNLNLDETDFYPLPENPPRKFQAVYNARLAHWKRHYLSAAIETCAFIYYRFAGSLGAEELIRNYHRDVAPGHQFVNKEIGDDVIPLTPSEVNSVLNNSEVGLCLSAEEGAMYSSLEYLLAGLPVVSTPSRGGRDRYFIDEYCIIANPDVREVRDAVIALRQKNIPRQWIRSEVLRKVKADRREFINLLNTLRLREGFDELDADSWPFRSKISRPNPFDHYEDQLRSIAYPNRIVDKASGGLERSVDVLSF